MGIRLSTSSKNKYLTCGHMYDLHYNKRLRSVVTSSALSFGKAMDEALNHMLLNKDDKKVLKQAKVIFNKHWEQGEDVNKQIIDLPLNPNIKYFKSDYDPDLLDKSEWKELLSRDEKFFDTKNEIDEQLKQNVNWMDIPEEKRMIYNYAHWLCLQKKAMLLLTAYYTDIIPQIKTVIDVQKKLELDDGEGNILNGVLDARVILQDNRKIILDNKTSSEEYEKDSVKGSEQLATYQEILAIQGDPVDACGYAVLVKKLDKDITKTCKQCGAKNESTHKTCPEIVNNKRCNGEFNKVKKFKVRTQLLVDTINQKFAESVLENAHTVKSCIELGLFPKNFSACDNQFGQKCIYYSKCHGGDDKGLVQLEDKK